MNYTVDINLFKFIDQIQHRNIQIIMEPNVANEIKQLKIKTGCVKR